MNDLKSNFTNYIHKFIDNTQMPYQKGFDFFVLKNALSKENETLRQDIFNKQLYQTQKLTNTFYLKEIKKIIEFGKSSGIKIVFMKGFYLAEKIYDDANLRITTDIDLLICEEDLVFVHEFFIKNDFMYSGK